MLKFSKKYRNCKQNLNVFIVWSDSLYLFGFFPRIQFHNFFSFFIIWIGKKTFRANKNVVIITCLMFFYQVLVNWNTKLQFQVSAFLRFFIPPRACKYKWLNPAYFTKCALPVNNGSTHLPWFLVFIHFLKKVLFY